MQHAFCVHIEQEIPVGVLRLVHRRPHAERAGDVAQDVDASEALERLVRGALHAVRIPQVGLDEDVVIGFRFLSIEQHQARAELIERLRHRAAEVAGGARHHDRALVEPHLPLPDRKRGTLCRLT